VPQRALQPWVAHDAASVARNVGSNLVGRARPSHRAGVLGRVQPRCSFASRRLRRFFAASPLAGLTRPALAGLGWGPSQGARARRLAMLKIYDTVIEVVRGLKPVIAEIEESDRDLARQLRRAAASVALNTEYEVAPQSRLAGFFLGCRSRRRSFVLSRSSIRARGA